MEYTKKDNETVTKTTTEDIAKGELERKKAIHEQRLADVESQLDLLK